MLEEFTECAKCGELFFPGDRWGFPVFCSLKCEDLYFNTYPAEGEWIE
jgi:endogenous inhibitor of DNA gyrase (YacG/DUF329 family)